MKHITQRKQLRRIRETDTPALANTLQPVKPNGLNKEICRRRFLKTYTATLGATVLMGPYLLRGQNLNSKIAFASVWMDGWGNSSGDVNQAQKHGGSIVALCDVDSNRLRSSNRFDAKTYTDYRRLYDEVGKSIDAVIISTPDHHTAVASVMALRMGKHVYCQKPLCQNIAEARLMVKLAGERNVAGQRQ